MRSRTSKTNKISNRLSSKNQLSRSWRKRRRRMIIKSSYQRRKRRKKSSKNSMQLWHNSAKPLLTMRQMRPERRRRKRKTRQNPLTRIRKLGTSKKRISQLTRIKLINRLKISRSIKASSKKSWRKRPRNLQARRRTKDSTQPRRLLSKDNKRTRTKRLILTCDLSLLLYNSKISSF